MSKQVPEKTITNECKYCAEDEPEWSPYAKCWIHRRATLDKRCTRKRLGPVGELEPQQGLCEHKRKPFLCNVCCATQVAAPAAPLLSALDIAKKLVNAGGIDRREKVLKQWVDSYIARWAAALEQVTRERDNEVEAFENLHKHCEKVEAELEQVKAALQQIKVWASCLDGECKWGHKETFKQIVEAAEAALGEKGESSNG